MISKIPGLLSLAAVCLAAVDGPLQRPLTSSPSQNSSPRWSSVRIREAQWYDVGYSLNVSIGSPPQPVPVYLDISSPDSWITPTSLPQRHRVCNDTLAFNTTASSTLIDTDKFARFHYDWVWGYGNLSYDTVRYGTVAASHQAFAIPKYVDSDSWFFNPCPMVGIMGLAPFHSRTESDDFGRPSPFVTMVRQGTLERNLFALRLREPAALSFGRVDPDSFQGEFLAEVPLTREISGRYDGGWQTTASHLAVQDWDVDQNFRSDLGGVPATFTTRDPAMHLPEPVYNRVMAATGCSQLNGAWLPPAVDCTNRFAMPNVTFNLAGFNLTLTAFDYTIPWELEPGELSCACMFTTSSGFNWSKELLLGWAFLRKFYSVFDLDSMSIRFAKLS